MVVWGVYPCHACAGGRLLTCALLGLLKGRRSISHGMVMNMGLALWGFQGECVISWIDNVSVCICCFLIIDLRCTVDMCPNPSLVSELGQVALHSQGKT